MSDDLTRSHGGALAHGQLSSDKIISLALQAIEAYRDDARRTQQQDPSADPKRQPGLQRPGLTVALGGYKIISLPDELIDIIKDEIERWVVPPRGTPHADAAVGWPSTTTKSRRSPPAWSSASG
jgi:hypothetical protein